MSQTVLDSLSSQRLVQRRRVDAICSNFEADWRAAAGRTPPRLDDYLRESPEPERSALLSELIPLDAAYRRLAGEEPQPHDYLDRFAGLDPAWLERVLRPEEPADIRTRGTAGSEPGMGVDAKPGSPAGEHQPSEPRYRILRPHAQGGLGQVFVAEDQELHRDVALKEIRAQHAHDPVSRARFVLEAKITAGLEHPGIVPVYGFGCYDDGRPYYAMRFVQGESFQNSITRLHAEDGPDREPGERSLAFRQLLRRFLDMCNAVAYAHSRGVLHRDLKPANVMLGPYGETLVVDWGLAKMVGHRDTETELRPRLGIEDMATEEGTPVGTPAYMSPEQASGQQDLLGPVSDVYGLGATLYCLLTGESPYHGDHLEEVLRRVQRGELRAPREVKPGVPLALDRICRKALAPRPEERYPSALALAEDLEHWLADEPVTAYREPWPAKLVRWGRRHRAWVVGAAAVLLTVVAALAVGLVVVKNEKEHTEQALAAELEARQQAQAALASEAKARLRTREALDAIASQGLEGLLSRQKGKLEPAQDAFLRKALASYREFTEESGNSEPIRRGVANAHWRVGHILILLGEHAKAEEALRHSIAYYEQLVADFPEVTDYRSDLADTQRHLGALLRSTGRPKDAEKAYHEALTLQQQLVAGSPSQPHYRSQLANSYNSLAILRKEAGRHQEAEGVYRDALAIQQQLADEFPAVPEYRQLLATTHSNVGNLLDDMGRPKEAEASYRDAIALLKQLVDQFPAVPRYRQQLASSHNNLATVLRTKKDQLGKAEAEFRAAIALLAPLAAEFPAVPTYRQDLASSQQNLGNLLHEIGRPQDAEGPLRVALALNRQLAAEFPNVPDYRNELADTMVNLALILRRRGDLSAAREMLEEATPHHQAALKTNPKNLVYQEYYRNNRALLAGTLAASGDHVGASQMAEQLAALGFGPALNAFNAASTLAQCILAVQKDTKLPESHRQKLAQSYADRAMALLRQSITKGFRDVNRMKRDSKLDPLRKLPDFGKLIAVMEEQEKMRAK